MTFRYEQMLTLVLIALSSFGCNVSLQSSQFAFAKNLLEPKMQVAEKNWQVSWDGRLHDVYAVNHENGIYFANESGLTVTFAGSQVTRLSLPGSRAKKVAQITKSVLADGSISLRFQNEDSPNLGRHLCSSWIPVASRDGSKSWYQQCGDGSNMYTNEIRANDQGQIVALKQVLLPGVNPILIVQL